MDCVECGQQLRRGNDPVVWVRFQDQRGRAIITGRVPMHLLCSMKVVDELEARGWRSNVG